MRKWIMMFAMVLGLTLLGARAQAAESGTILVTVSLATETSVTLSPTAWNIGPISRGSISGPQSFTATVGNSATKLEIKGENPIGGWTLGASAGTDRFAVTVAVPELTLTTAYQVLAASVAAYGNMSFGLTYHAPTADTLGAGIDQSFSVTVKASAP